MKKDKMYEKFINGEISETQWKKICEQRFDRILREHAEVFKRLKNS